METRRQRNATKNYGARCAAIGAAVAVSFGAGGFGLVRATSPSGASAYVPTEPCRIIDTRSGDSHVGPFGTLNANSKITVEARGNVGECTGNTALPSNATGLQLNVTPIGASRNTNLRIYAGGGNPPNASSLNPSPGQPPIPNAVTVELDNNGVFSVYNFQGNVDVAIDVVGHYADHNHDDRYYTKGQSDNRYYTKGQSDNRYYTQEDVDGLLTNNPWDVIPAGVTVTGVITVDTGTHGSTTYDAVSVELPGVAPVALTADTVNFADAAATDTDPECTGTAAQPTAPSGRVCLYLSGLATLRVETPRGFASDLPTRAFEVRFNPDTTNQGLDMYLYATWAYTAPESNPSGQSANAPSEPVLAPESK